MKLVFVVITTLAVLIDAHCQDLIITVRGDSINCKIDFISRRRIGLTYRDAHEIRKTTFPKSFLVAFEKGFFPNQDSLFDNSLLRRKQRSDSIPVKVRDSGMAYESIPLPTIRFSSDEYLDLVVKGNGDSLKCKIVSITNHMVVFEFASGATSLRGDLPRGEVVHFQRNYWSLTKPQEPDKVKKVQFGINFGIGYRTFRIPRTAPSDVSRYLRSFKFGVTYNAELAKYFTKAVGVGFKYTRSIARHKTDDNLTNALIERISISYFGPVLRTRLSGDDDNRLFALGVGPGVLSYRYLAKVGEEKIIATGNDIGITFDAARFIPINYKEKTLLVLQMATYFGSVSKFKVRNGNDTVKIEAPIGAGIKLGRIDFMVGLRF